jgi:molecular chaperone GrpE (heat shock protein)
VLLFELAYAATVVVLAVVVARLIKTRRRLLVARADFTRTRTRTQAEAEQEAARAAAQAAREMAQTAERRRAEVAGMAADAMTQTTEALQIARQIEKVSARLDALIERIGIENADGGLAEGPPQRGRHEMPGEPS